MFFSVSNPQHLPLDKLKSSCLLRAKLIVLTTKLEASDIQIDEYLKKEFKITLRRACWEILLNAQFTENTNGDVTVVFKNKQIDELATLISYGTIGMPGSNILRNAIN